MRMAYAVLVLTIFGAATTTQAAKLGASIGSREHFEPNVTLSATSGYLGGSKFCAEYTAGTWYDWNHPFYMIDESFSPAYAGNWNDRQDKGGLHSSVRLLFSGESGARAHGHIGWFSIGGGIGLQSKTDGEDEIDATWTFIPLTEQLLRFSVRTGETQELTTELTIKQPWRHPRFFADSHIMHTLSLGVGYKFRI